ncbi:MAG: preprotein translocase subunit SecE [Ruminococcaceae bacterium]|nr:preprotein translocase subunit SecE [Oscillospiraceae bacterium]
MAENEKKVQKSDKPSFFSRIGAWFKSLKAECKKITWASAKLVKQNTILVVVCVAIVAAAIGILDFAFSQTIQGLAYIF